MFNVFNNRQKRLKQGDLVEITLTSDAKRNRAFDSYSATDIEEVSFSERVISGYVVGTENYYIDITQVWNKIKKEPENGRIRIYKDAIKTCRKK